MLVIDPGTERRAERLRASTARSYLQSPPDLVYNNMSYNIHK